ncbi:ribonuclease P protein component [Hanstruepera marina]|uniref:ribonuclease P protein component n=1 Tax=Hanstruepera marina TaxID=2873265 RepID=UPI001CA6313C|nr:ribonuclease P protein component [Hanstruepera marina]
MKGTYSKKEKLKSKKLIDKLFSEGKSVSSYPLRMVYLATELNASAELNIGVSVSKRHFKKAPDRNRIKRLMREAYRLNKTIIFNNITTQYALMILYIGNDKPKYSDIESATVKLFNKFVKATKKLPDDEKIS